MSQGTTIEWTDASWNPVRGCTRISEGCRHCYAEQMAARFSGRNPQTGKPMWGASFATSKGVEPRWTGKVELIPDQLDWPLRWNGSKKAKAEGRPSRIFVNSTSDLFHEKLSDEDIDKVFAVMALAPQHTFQVLTKRADRMRSYLSSPGIARRISEFVCDLALDRQLGVALIAPGVDERLAPPGIRIYLDRWPLPNVWLGVSTENQETADERIPHLLETPAAVRFISAEPLIGPIDLTMIPTGEKFGENDLCENALTGPPDMQPGERLDWVIAGGESGRGDVRTPRPDWLRKLRDDCAADGVPFFFKQWGEWVPLTQAPKGLVLQGSPAQFVGGSTEVFRVGKGEAGHELDGRTHREFPRA